MHNLNQPHCPLMLKSDLSNLLQQSKVGPCGYILARFSIANHLVDNTSTTDKIDFFQTTTIFKNRDQGF